MMIIIEIIMDENQTILNLTINLNNHIILNVSHRGHRLHTLKHSTSSTSITECV